jgi:hypothetical protein
MPIASDWDAMNTDESVLAEPEFSQQSPAVAVPNIEVTPEMLRAAQLKSELGGYVCSNWAGAYAAITDLFNVMMSAVPQASAEQKDKIFKIGQLAATLDCMDMDEAWARQGIFDIVTELTGKTMAEMFAAAKQSAQDEGKV